jgi:hypothetical protein
MIPGNITFYKCRAVAEKAGISSRLPVTRGKEAYAIVERAIAMG